VPSEDQAGWRTDRILGDVLRHPVTWLVRRWNWKSAILSSTSRSIIFFLANLDAGIEAARAAFLTELVFRASTAGFYGALTQALRRADPPWAGTAAAMVLLPAVAHTVEFVVHYARGTVRLADSLIASALFTAVSTSFNLYAMRQGALIVGEDGNSLGHDLRRLPRLLTSFVLRIVRSVARSGLALRRAAASSRL
jgi:hypothetical protein